MANVGVLLLLPLPLLSRACLSLLDSRVYKQDQRAVAFTFGLLGALGNVLEALRAQCRGPKEGEEVGRRPFGPSRGVAEHLADRLERERLPLNIDSHTVPHSNESQTAGYVCTHIHISQVDSYDSPKGKNRRAAEEKTEKDR